MTDTTPPTISRGRTDELIPCPAGHIGTTRNNNNIYGTWWVQCRQCAWRTAGDTEAEALTAWNTRANADARLVEALRDCVAVLTDPIVGTIYHDDPDWYQALDRAVAKARAALSEVSHG